MTSRLRIGYLRRTAPVLTVVAALALGGCAAVVADLPVVGLPEGTPARPQNPGEFPAVHDIPAERGAATLDAAEKERVQQELLSARDRQSRMAPK